MARVYRQNTPYEEILKDSEGESASSSHGNGGHGNTRLPFGLCERFGIALPDNATPHDAWEAIKKETGLSPQDFYERLSAEEGKNKRQTSNGADKKPSTPKFQTVREAQNYAEKTFGVTCDYSGISVEVANEMNAAIERGRQLCPTIMDGIKFVGSAQKRNTALRKELTEYLFRKYKSQTPYYSDAILWKMAVRKARKCVPNVKSSELAFASRYTGDPNGPIGKIVMKYVGIFVNDSYARNAQYFSGVMQFAVSTGHSPIGCDSISAVFDHEVGHEIDYSIDLRNDAELVSLFRGMQRSVISKGLSGYGATSIGEFIAEAYSEYCNNPNPRPIAKQVYEIIRRKLGK